MTNMTTRGATTLAGQLPAHLSHSQYSTFSRCGELFRLERVWHVPRPPAWALIGGKAFHSATEDIDRAAHGSTSGVRSFQEHLELGLAEDLAGTDYTEADVRASGRASAAWPDKENRKWWEFNGPLMVKRWEAFTKTAPLDLALSIELTAEYPETGVDVPAIEVPFRLIAGSSTIVGYVDRVYRQRADGALVVLDLKSGSSSQPSPAQLGLYKVGLEAKFGEPVQWGYFWDARTGALSERYDLSVFTHDRIEWQYESFRFARDRGLFLPNITKDCSWCGVRDFCVYMGGARSAEVPTPWDLLDER